VFGVNDLIVARDSSDAKVDCGLGAQDLAQLDPLPLDNGPSDCETKTRR
jgi:hypothetical protein